MVKFAKFVKLVRKGESYQEEFCSCCGTPMAYSRCEYCGDTIPEVVQLVADQDFLSVLEAVKGYETAIPSDYVAAESEDGIKAAIMAGRIKTVVATTANDCDGPDGYSCTEGSVQELLEAVSFWFPRAYEVRFDIESVRFTTR